MRPLSYLAAGAAACASALYGGPGSERLITVAQRDGARSAKTPRTVDVSADGRYVAFQSWVRLVAADGDDLPDVYVLDRLSGNVTLESGDDDPSLEHSHPRISGDGRFVVFESRARLHLESRVDIVLRDRERSLTRGLTAHANPGNVFAWSRAPDISDDGRRVAFSSAATALAAGPDMNGPLEDVYVIDLASNATMRASVNSAGVQFTTGSSVLPSLNTDGSIVAFATTAPLDGRDASAAVAAKRQIYVRDLNAGTTTRVSRAARGDAPNGDSSTPSISGDGRYVAYVSDAANIVADDQNRGADVFLFDRETSTTMHVSRAADGSGANGTSISAVVSADGRYVVFQSDAGNLTCTAGCPPTLQDINLLWDVFVWDRAAGRSTRASEDELGGWIEWSAGPAIDRSGRVVAFSSRHPMDPSDRAEDLDLFVRSLPPAAAVSAAKK